MLRTVIALGFAVSACSSPPQAEPAKSPDHALIRAPEPGAPEVPWARKTRDQKMEFMGLHFFPKMRALFKTFDAKAYGQFRCQTCHGKNMEAVDYKMPNGIYALPAEGAEKAALEYDEKTARFMIETVLPATRELLGKNDPEFSRSMSCNSCHPKE